MLKSLLLWSETQTFFQAKRGRPILVKAGCERFIGGVQNDKSPSGSVSDLEAEAIKTLEVGKTLRNDFGTSDDAVVAKLMELENGSKGAQEGGILKAIKGAVKEWVDFFLASDSDSNDVLVKLSWRIFFAPKDTASVASKLQGLSQRKFLVAWTFFADTLMELNFVYKKANNKAHLLVKQGVSRVSDFTWVLM
ncbi:hypothetical protein V6N11_028197 [Hibiscus sabdariffa]|uniref:Plastid lipid-associated protein/fibrillin conserved domain-containing protein n=1 Tax=Hibiscus sabdariffa TaxID=183260 RepID=A0ABR2N6L8_9ROSI